MPVQTCKGNTLSFLRNTHSFIKNTPPRRERSYPVSVDGHAP